MLLLASILAKVNDAEVIFLRVAEYPYTLYTTCYEYPLVDPGRRKSILNKEMAICQDIQGYLEQIISTLECIEYTRTQEFTSSRSRHPNSLR